MAQDEQAPAGPDLAQGISAADLAEGGMLAGHVGDDPVLLVRHGGRVSLDNGPDRGAVLRIALPLVAEARR